MMCSNIREKYCYTNSTNSALLSSKTQDKIVGCETNPEYINNDNGGSVFTRRIPFHKNQETKSLGISTFIASYKKADWLNGTSLHYSLSMECIHIISG